MNTSSKPVDLVPVLLAILAVLAIPVVLYLVAIPITYYRRQQQQRANPEVRFNTSLLRASFWTFAALFIPAVILLGLFVHSENGQLKLELQFHLFDAFFADPRGWIVVVVGLLVFGYIGLLAYLVFSVKPMLYRGQYERALKNVRRWKWLPFSGTMLADFDGSILLFAGRYVEAEGRYRKAEKGSKKAARELRGIVLGNLGWSLLRQGRYDEALPFLEESVQKYPEGTDNFNALGEAYLLRGTDPGQALQYLERGILNKRYRMKTDRYVWGELLANRAWALAQAGSCGEALQSFKKALAEAEKGCLPALAGLHYRGAQIMRLCGSPEQANAQLDEAIRLDPAGGYGQMAKAAKSAPETVREQPGTAQAVIKAATAAVAQAIREHTPASQQFQAIRENLVLLAKGKEFATLYLLRPQSDGTTLLRVIIHETPIVEAAVLAPDLKAGLATLLSLPELRDTASAAATGHLQTISQAVQRPEAGQPAPQPASPPLGARPDRPIITPLPPRPSQAAEASDPFAVLARKPLPSVTAATSQPFQPGTLNPSWYATMAVFFGGILLAPVLAYKWRGLGKPSWMWWTLGAAILTGFVVISLLVGLRIIPDGPGRYVLVALALGINYGFVFALASVQEGAYQKVRQEGPEALAGYTYNFRRAGLIGGGFIAGSILLGIVLYVARPAPVKYENKLLTLTYPAGWKTDDVNKIDVCKTKQEECFILLYEGRFGYTAMLVGRFWVGATMSPTDIERNTWAQFVQRTPGIKLESRDTLKVGGYSAARRFYFTPPSSPQDDDMDYNMQVYIPRGQAVYYISVWSENKPIFEEERSTVDEILSSLRLKEATVVAQ